MARALIRNYQDQIDGANLSLALTVTYYGSDVPNGSDTSLCTVSITPSMTETQVKSAIRTAVINEAKRLDYPFATNGAITYLGALLAGV